MTPARRIFDILFALYLAAFLAPVLIVVIYLCLRHQGRPLFYGSERMQRLDRGFTLWKFRTMDSAPADSGVSGGDKAARITPLGARLRRLRLDELPQLWNIIRGDVSFVGPRPPLREYTERFPEIYGPVLRDRPGVTGLASLVFAPHEARLLDACTSPAQTDAVYCAICIPRKARLDLLYQTHRTFWRDLKLIAWTTAKFLPRRIRPRRKGRLV
jgi:lipopolysaccharide/colanic/teichoic acid biosynthesis glycosyltransferase